MPEVGPITGGAIATTPLVSEATYRRLTGDTTTASAAVVAALTDAQRMLEDALHRPIGSDVRTEVVDLWPSSVAYPVAQPVTAVPAGATIHGAGVRGGLVTLADGTTTLTYTGGWVEATAPMVIIAAICQAARDLLTPADDFAAAGLRQYSVGDVSVTRDTVAGAAITWPSGVMAYRRRVV